MSKNSNALKYTEPDHEKVMAAIKQQVNNRSALVLLLAYHAAMLPSEMQTLRWENISDDFRTIHMDNGRKIPITEELAMALKTEAVFGCDPWKAVLNSRNSAAPYALKYISKLTSDALGFAGIHDVTAADLRISCVLRWLQQYPVEQVARMSGREVASLKQSYRLHLPANTKLIKTKPLSLTEISLELIEEIYEKHAYDEIGFLMAMTVVGGVTIREVLDLTWENVDLTAGVVSFPGKDVLLADAQIAFLQNVKRYSEIPYVLVTPQSKNKYDIALMGHKIEIVFDREGYGDVTLYSLQQAYEHIQNKNAIMAIAEEKGEVYIDEMMQLLGIAYGEASRAIKSLIEEGLLIKIGNTHYDAQKVLPPEKYIEVIETLCEEKGRFLVRDFAKAVGLPARDAATQLRILRREGKVHLSDRNYYSIVLDRQGDCEETPIHQYGKYYIPKKNATLALLEKTGTLHTGDVMQLFGITRTEATALIKDMVGEGILLKINNVYYDAKKTLPPEKYIEVIETLRAEKGYFRLGDFAKAVGLPLHTASRQLDILRRKGQVHLTEQTYH